MLLQGSLFRDLNKEFSFHNSILFTVYRDADNLWSLVARICHSLWRWHLTNSWRLTLRTFVIDWLEWSSLSYFLLHFSPATMAICHWFFNPNLIWDYPVLGFIFLVENVLKHLLKPYWGKFTVYFKNSVSFVLREKSTLFLVFENVICHGRFGFFSDTQRCLGVGLQRALQFNWIYFGKKR